MKKLYQEPILVCEFLGDTDLLCYSLEQEGAGDEIEF